MVVTYGEPLQHSAPLVLSITWEECLQRCWNDTTCVLTHDTTPTCDYYSFQGISTVRKLTSGSRVGFRLLKRDESCFTELTEPILQDGTVWSDILKKADPWINNIYVPYSITLANNVWTIQMSSKEFSCIPPAMPVRRANKIIWCMVTQTSGSLMNMTQAQDHSRAQFQQTLAGPANEEEATFLRDSALNFVNDPPPWFLSFGCTAYGFWVDGTRKATCMPQNYDPDTCNGTNQFDYTDTNAQPPYLEWLAGQPDGMTSSSKADCVYFIARNAASGIDDMPCPFNNFTNLGLCMIGYYSGRIMGPDTAN
ncbi:unnamed protein product [Caenorhabditis brenneri]